MSVPALSLGFVSEAAAQAAVADAGEPDWLLAERVDAVRRVADLPAESNQLFTPYLDLRSAHFETITVAGTARGITSAGQLPDGAAALVATDGTRSASRVLGAEALAAGVIIDTLGNVLRDHPAILGDAIRDSATLPEDDAFAQVPRAVSTLGLVIAVPAGVQLEQPIVLRSGAGERGTGSIGRTIVVLGAGASARHPGGAAG